MTSSRKRQGLIKKTGAGDLRDTIHESFEVIAARIPDSVALVADGVTYSYSWLDQQANGLAAQLCARGARQEQRIAVYLERSPRMLVAMLAVLKTGAAYVPIDPHYPADRIAVILEDAQASLILTTRQLCATLNVAQERAVCLDELTSEPSAQRPAAPPDREALAYVLFTSGSTGRPKGVAICHRNVMDMLTWGRAEYDDAQLSGVLAATSICFDLSIFELFLPLVCGGRVILAASALALDELADAGVTLVNTVPSAITELLHLGAIPTSVKTVNLAGEPLRTHLVDALYQLPQIEKVYNLYGPSEDTTYSTYALIPRQRQGEPRIGRPLPQSQVHIQDEQGHVLAKGEQGELCISGAGLARGYLGRGGLTAARFVPHDGAEPGSRVYRTGDLARWLPDGELEYLGRVDQQVKLRGFRIELGEIEAVLHRHPAVDEAGVVVRDMEGEKLLVAFIGLGPHTGVAPSGQELEDLCGQHLPAYMLPSGFVFLAAMAHTPNGKIDRRALQALPLTRDRMGQLVAIPTAAPSEGESLIPADRLFLLETLNATQTDYPRERSVHAVFATVAAAQPEATAVLREGISLSYAELEARANRLAQRLRTFGLRAEEPVGIVGDRSLAAVVAPLAVLKLGACYVPLDPDNPRERNAAVIADTAMRILLASEGGPFEGMGLCCIDPAADLDGQADEVAPVWPEWPDQLAYIIFTSGSTGRPKGVAIPHRGLVRLVCNNRFLEVTPADTILQVSTFAFDAINLELWAALLNGACLRLTSGKTEALARELAAAPVTILHLTAQLFNFMVDEHLDLILKVPRVLTGGDAISPVHARRFREAGGQQLLCCYGPTEGTTLSTTFAFPQGPLPYKTVPLGKPLGNTYVYVVDRHFALAGLGTFGELLIGGDGLARGYYGRPALTAQVFVPHPFARSAGERVYRSGDLARWHGEGVLEFGGRIDHQVKVRGFRIEVAEIERHLSAVAGVRNVVVGARELAGDKRLIAWLTRDDDGPDEARLREALAAVLPDYMMPSAFVFMSELPTQLSGKLRRADLPLPELNLTAAYVAPQTERERQLAGIWQEVLGVAQVGREDNFFMLGGHSLLAIRILAHIARDLGLQLSIAELLAHATLADQARVLEHAASTKAAPWAPAMVASEGAALPLSFAQERIFFQYQLEPESTMYNVSLLFRLQGELDQERLKRCLEAMIARHAILRTRYVSTPDGNLQIIEKDAPLLFMALDLRGLPARSREKQALRQLSATAALPFDLEQGPVWRWSLVRLDTQMHFLVLDVHHIAFDYSSTAVLLDELSHGYNSDPTLVQLDPLPLQYADFAYDQRKHETLNSEGLEYWLRQLKGAKAGIALPFDYPKPAKPRQTAASYHFELSESLSTRLRSFCAARGTTAYGPLLAAFAALLGQISGQAELCLGTPGANRDQPLLQRLIGFFVNTLVLRLQLDQHPSFVALSQHAQAQMLQALAHQDVPFEHLVAHLGADRSVGQGALFQVMFSLLRRPEPRQLGGDLLLRAETSPFTPLLFDLFLAMEDTGSCFIGALEYDADRFAAETMARMATDYLCLLERALAEPLQALIKLMPESAPKPSAEPAPSEVETQPAQFSQRARTLTQQRLASLWQDMMHLDQIQVDDNFFQCGGHSLMATRMVARTRGIFGVRIPLAAFFKQPSLRSLARLVDEALAVGKADPLPLTAVARNHPDVVQGFPMSFAQERLWFLHRLEPQSPNYNMPLVLRIKGALDIEALQRSCRDLVARHEVLHSRFFESEGEPRQLADPHRPLCFDQEQLSGAHGLEQRLFQEGMRPFDLTQEHAVRFTLFHTGADHHVLLANIHHIAFDGWSIDVIAKDLAALYEAHVCKREPQLAAPEVFYADYAWHQRNGQTQLDAGLSWWEDQLKGAEFGLELPFERLAKQSEGLGEDLPLVLSEDLTRQLRRFCASEGLSPFMPLAATFATLLARYCDQPELTLGTPSANRESEQTNDIVGFFVNTLVLRFALGHRPSFRQLVAQTRDTVSDAVAHQDVPYDQLVARLARGRDAAASLFQAVFHMPEPFLQFRTGNLECKFEKPPFPVAKFPLLLSMVDDGPALMGELTFDASLFRREAVGRLVEHFPLLLRVLLEHPDASCMSEAYLSPAERQQVIYAWNESPDTFPREQDLPAVFESIVARQPDALALSYDQDQLSYSELYRRACQLANFLLARGLRFEEPVAVVAGKSLDGAIAPLAVVLAGGCYVPIDPANPEERNLLILEDVGVRTVFFSGEPICLGQSQLDVFDLVAMREELALKETALPPRPLSPESLLCVFFTSGSTGRPKGVGIKHRGGLRLGFNSVIGVRPHDIVLQFSSFAFDAASWDYWGTWLNGAQLRMMHDKMENLYLILRQFRVTVLFMTTQFFHFMVDEHLQDLVRVGLVLTGGEVTSPQHARRFFQAGGKRLFNMYGPTENTTYASGYEMLPDQEIPAPLPVGKPVPHSNYRIVDRSLQLVPAGVFGELCQGGDGVSRGYLGRPNLTAEKFVPDPWSELAGSRIYRSGDRGRWLPDGNVDFGGRFDHQLKLRGFRIEVGEIEHHLTRIEGVRDAVVEARVIGGDKRLVAWMILTHPLSSDELRQRLARELPPYMVPAVFVFLDSFPVHPNGKVRRRELPVPEAEGESEYAAPSTPLEQTLAGIWQAVIGCAKVGLGDNFFELGGHSLLATRCLARVQRELGVTVPVVALFEHASLEAFASYVAKLQGVQGPGVSLTTWEGEPSEGFELTFAQAGLWFIDQAHAGAAFVIPVRHRLLGPLQVQALEQSLEHLGARHQALRTFFSRSQPLQFALASAPIAVKLIDLSGLSKERAEAVLYKLQRLERKQPFALDLAPLLRCTLLRLTAQNHALLLTMHHIVSDGMSVEILVRQLADVYGHLVRGQLPQSESPSVQFSDYVHWQKGQLETDASKAQLGQWLTRLGGDLNVLYVDRPRPAQPSGACADRIIELPVELNQRIATFCREQGITRFIFFAAAVMAALRAHSGQDDILIGTASANRDQPELQDMVGFFVNLLALRVDLSGGPSTGDLLARVKTTVLEAFAQKDTPFELIVNHLNPERRGYNAIFQVLFNYINMELVPPSVAGLSFTPIFEELGHTRYDLLFTITEAKDAVQLIITWQEELFETATVDALAAYIESLLDVMISDPEQALDGIAFGNLAAVPPSAPKGVTYVAPKVEHRDLALPAPKLRAPVIPDVVPIGKAFHGIYTHVLDGDQHPMPAGLHGEIYIGGPTLARGYLRRPSLTAEKFVPNLHARMPGERLYRTGDKGFLQRNGDITLSGRIDDQVKIRGFRVEPGEVEAALTYMDEVRQALVLVRDVSSGVRELVAFVLVDAASSALEQSLRERLKQQLPPYMVPAFLCSLVQFPTTPNGKIDRKRLLADSAKLSITDDPGSTDEAALQDEVEHLLAAIWGEVLERDQILANQSFFDLGGHSLLAVSLLSRIRERFAVEFSLKSIFQHPVLREMANLLRAGQPAKNAHASPVVADQHETRLLSLPQRSLFFLEYMQGLAGGADQLGSTYNLPVQIFINGPLALQLLDRAFKTLVARHEILHSRYPHREGQPFVELLPPERVTLSMIDLSRIEDAQAVAQRLMEREKLRPFHISVDPLCRLNMLRIEPQRHALMVTMHHIITDGWSFALFFKELEALYTAFLAEKPAQLPELPLKYTDFAAWQHRLIAAGTMEEDLQWWQQQLALVPSYLELPTDKPRPAQQTFSGARYAFSLDREVSLQLHRLAETQGCTLFVLLQALYGILLARHSGQDDFCIGSPVAGRSELSFEGILGYFANLLPFRFRYDERQTLGQLLAQTRNQTFAIFAHQNAPLDLIVQRVLPTRSLAISPLIQTTFTLQNATKPNGLPGCNFQELSLELDTTKFELTFSITEYSGYLECELVYNSDLFDRQGVQRLAMSFETLTRAALDAVQTPLFRLSLCSAEEKNHLLAEWSRINEASPAGTVLDQITARAHQQPDHRALVYCDEGGETVLSYRELQVAALSLAAQLCDKGIGVGHRVGIYMAPGPEVLVNILGVLLCGAAYLPLDPDYPHDRLRFMVEDSDLSLILCQKQLLAAAGSFPAELLALSLEDLAQPLPSAVGPVHPEQCAYVIYTSGTTGQPKGVMIHHRGLQNLCTALWDICELSPSSRMLQMAAFSFDASVLEWSPTLAAGGTLIQAPRQLLLPGPSLNTLIKDRQITHMFTPPSLLANLDPREIGPDVAILCGGEASSAALLERWSVNRFFNVYGPTETTIAVSVFKITEPLRKHCASHHLVAPLGRPLQGMQMVVLDRHGYLLPTGVQGELCIGGVGLAYGYVGQPAVTALKFIPNPYGEDPGDRLYRSGDLVRWLPMGEGTYMEFRGRLDHQLKLRGFRVELGEIEANLASHASVDQVAVLAITDTHGDVYLNAFVVPSQDYEVCGDYGAVLRAHLEQVLPPYMIPARFSLLESLPRTPVGKLDRRALAGMASKHALTATQTAYRAPEGLVETALAKIWQELLNIEQVGADDNFFELGGHSLLAVRLVAQIRRQLGLQPNLPWIFQHPTIAGLANRLADCGALQELILPLNEAVNRPELFLVHAVGGQIHWYLPVARALSKHFAVYGIQAKGLHFGKIETELEHIVTHYVDELQKIQPQGPYLLGGWSVGGTIAMEMVQELQRRGEQVKHLVLIDAVRLSRDADINQALSRLRHLVTLAVQAQQSGDSGIMASEIAKSSELLGLLQEEGMLSEGHGPESLERTLRFQIANLEAVLDYVPAAKLDTPVLLIRSSESIRHTPDPSFGWSAFCNPDLADLEGNHYSLLSEEKAEDLAEALLTHIQ